MLIPIGLAAGALKRVRREASFSMVVMSSRAGAKHRMPSDSPAVNWLQALAADLGISFEIRLWADSSAAKSIAIRKGLGKMRHLAIPQLWLQDAVRDGLFTLRKVAGTENPANVLTKPTFEINIRRLLAGTGITLVKACG